MLTFMDARRVSRAVTLALVVGALGAAAPFAFADSGPLSWSAPMPVDHVPAGGTAHGVTDMSCPLGGSLCVSVDDTGGVLASTNAANGVSSWGALADIDGPHKLTSVSCPTATFCAAVDDAGRVMSTTNPTGPASAWSTPAVIDSGESLAGISCPSASLCVVASGGDGNVITATNPRGAAGAWTTTHLGGTLTGATCPTTTLCLLGDLSGNLRVATTPTGGASAWSTTQTQLNLGYSGNGRVPLSVSCPSASLCAVASASGLITATNPAGGVSAWSSPILSSASYLLLNVDCPTTSICVMTDDGGDLFTSTNPTGGASAWNMRTTPLGLVNALTIPGVGVACSTNSLCVLYGQFGNISDATNPTGPSSAWSDVAQLDGAGDPSGVSCTANGGTLCVATDSNGDVLVSTNPGGGPSAWTRAHLDSLSLLAVSCASTSLCVATDEAGQGFISTDPTGGASAWKQATIDTATYSGGSPAEVLGVSCTTTSLCVATDGLGNVIWSTDPTGGASAWHDTNLLPSALLRASCWSSSCLVSGGNSDLFGSANPAAGATGWSSTTITHGGGTFYLDEVSCRSDGQCFGAGYDGGIKQRRHGRR